MKRRYWIAGASGLTGATVAAKLLMRPRDAAFEEHMDDLENAELSVFERYNIVSAGDLKVAARKLDMADRDKLGTVR